MISGNTDTSAMFKKPPAEKGKTQREAAFSGSTAFIQRAKQEPAMPMVAVAIWAWAASNL